MESERRKQGGEVEERLARIEEKLDNTLAWLSKRDDACEELEKRIVNLQVEGGKQSIVIWLFSGVISAFIAGVISYFSKKQ